MLRASKRTYKDYWVAVRYSLRYEEGEENNLQSVALDSELGVIHIHQGLDISSQLLLCYLRILLHEFTPRWVR